MNRILAPVMDHLAANRNKHSAFLTRQSTGEVLVYAVPPLDVIRSEYGQQEDVLSIPDPLSEDYLKAHAFDMGVQAVNDARLIAQHQFEKIGDDYCPYLLNHWGLGHYSAMFSGSEVCWPIGFVSYTTRRVIERWEDVLTAFHLNNKWVDYALEWWRGVESQDLTGLCGTPVYHRTPLDLANDLRGDQLFTDLYDAPIEVEILLEHCTKNIIALDKVFRDEIRFLREGPGGAQGAALASRTLVFNADPIDLISEPMGERFNTTWMETIAGYAGACLLHHHSIGASLAGRVSRIRGLTVQEILQDPNGPVLTEMVDARMIEASLRVPIMLEWRLDQFGYGSPMPKLDALLDRVRQGKFILYLQSADLGECRRFVESVRLSMRSAGDTHESDRLLSGSSGPPIRRVL